MMHKRLCLNENPMFVSRACIFYRALYANFHRIDVWTCKYDAIIHWQLSDRNCTVTQNMLLWIKFACPTYYLMQEMNHSHSARGRFEGNLDINPCICECLQTQLFSTQDFFNLICNKFHSMYYVTTKIIYFHIFDYIFGLE